MDRSAKGIRIAGALLLFVNLAVFFLPMTKIVHTNYGTKEFSAFQYLQNVIHPDSANPAMCLEFRSCLLCGDF